MSTVVVDGDWKATACILCSLNCGIKVKLDGRCVAKVRGDKAHPVSEGYLCQKAARLEHYQNHSGRITQPLRRREDGSFEEVSWDTALSEIAQRLTGLRDTRGGHSIAYYGGGGQGNHLPGAYSAAFRAALKTPYIYTSLAQEKTGDFWVNGKLFGRQTCHITEGIEEADFVLILGANPWQAHGIPQARNVLREFSKDPDRTMVVVDPRETQSAKMADIHLQVKPGGDAYLMLAMLGFIVQNGLEDREFLKRRTTGFERLREQLLKIDVPSYCERAGVPENQVVAVAEGLARAKSASTRHDLGLEQSLHSTLNCYLEKLLFLVTGNFGKRGCNNLHTQFVPVIGHSREPEEGGVTTKVTGMKEISRMFPPNILPLEIDTDHPERVRAVFVDSANPLQTGADSKAYHRAFSKLELLVTVDVAMTETARLAHYVLPASTQLEKTEATFFTLGFPTNHFHLRFPVMEPEGNTLSEPEIYTRLLIEMGAIPSSFPVLEKAAHSHWKKPRAFGFPLLLQGFFKLKPHLVPYASAVLYLTLGKALPVKQKSAAVLWGASQFYAQRYSTQLQRAGYEGKPQSQGEALFRKILKSKTSIPISTHTFDEVWSLVRHQDGLIHLFIPELVSEMEALTTEEHAARQDYPFILAAGERRSYNANQIYRDPAWRKNDPHGVLRIHPLDLEAQGFVDQECVLCETPYGQIEVVLESDEALRTGFITLPHGYGQQYPDPERPGEFVTDGPAINLLTGSEHCDALAKTPFHKHVPARLLARDASS